MFTNSDILLNMKYNSKQTKNTYEQLILSSETDQGPIINIDDNHYENHSNNNYHDNHNNHNNPNNQNSTINYNKQTTNNIPTNTNPITDQINHSNFDLSIITQNDEVANVDKEAYLKLVKKTDKLEKEKMSIIFSLETMRKAYENEKINFALAANREEKLKEYILDLESKLNIFKTKHEFSDNEVIKCHIVIKDKDIIIQNLLRKEDELKHIIQNTNKNSKNQDFDLDIKKKEEKINFLQANLAGVADEINNINMRNSDMIKINKVIIIM